MKYKNQLLVGVVFFSLIMSKANAIGFFPSPTFKELSVSSHFSIDDFYDSRIVEFHFVKEKWKLDFDYATKTFKPISDHLILSTNIPKTDATYTYHQLKVLRNVSQCTTTTGTLGSRDFSTVWVDGVEVLDDGEIHNGVGEENLSFTESDKSGLYAEHEVTVTFSELNIGVDAKCRGEVVLTVELML